MSDKDKGAQSLQELLESKRASMVQKPLEQCARCDRKRDGQHPKLCSLCVDLIDADERTERVTVVRMQIPPRYREASLDQFPGREVPELVGLDGILIVGENGVGKTHLAAAISNANAERFPSFVWKNVTELLAEIRDSFRGDGKGETSEKAIIANMSIAGLLVLDDVGAEKVTDWSLSTMYAILNRRHDHVRPTIVTTNKRLADIHDVEPRIASRLGAFHRIELKGDDRRLKKE